MIPRFMRALIVMAAAFGLLLTPATASAVAGKPTTLTLDAGGAEVKFKKGNKVQVKGKLGVGGNERELTLGLNVFAQVQVGASLWTDLTTRSCQPNQTFSLKLNLDVYAAANLRLYFPGTSVYASATSNVVAVVRL